ncbi:TetR/AcrR family transcriptional regulator [Dyadobacter sp. CY347]|uniref:TetR/AcrR family transcriptional regulator n=1 Tax=Dyadobacter sp. CY347 TaxID=2909336 RepID=UPI001F25C938|nr:TetR/AcrR family transcriptional regulator [Dyadobacter sp. CY347]MCF2487778.1 TetR/AcrR family transcriptional regulator [Dyadobacter sp. CY347]
MNNYHRKKEPAENRQHILDAALALAAEVSLENLTLDKVAKKANLSKGGLLHHFPKKDALIEELFDISLQNFLSLIRKEQASGVSPAMAYLKASINDDSGDKQNGAMKIFVQAIIYSPQYRERLQRWFKGNVISDIVTTSPTDLAAILIADGIWYSNVLGLSSLTAKQKSQIEILLTKTI